MPNRILKESICSSEQIKKLTPFEEAFFYRLIVNADDYGRLDGRIDIIRAKLYPLVFSEVKGTQVENAIKSLVKTGLAKVYYVDGKRYIWLTGWERNQQIRAKRSKYPSPSEADPASANNSEVIETKNQETEKHEEKEVAKADVVYYLILNDGSEYGILKTDYEMYKKLYPAVDVMQEFNNMKGWLHSNPSKRKTKNGIARFITAWLSKTQNKGGNLSAANYHYAREVEVTEGNPWR